MKPFDAKRSIERISALYDNLDAEKTIIRDIVEKERHKENEFSETFKLTKK